MTRATLQPATETGTCIKVPMAGIDYGAAPDELETLLGSCVGVALWDRTTTLGALAHVLLPDSQGKQSTTPGKYADTALAAMRTELVHRGANPLTMTAKLAGAAMMFGKESSRDVGQSNLAAVLAELQRHKIRVIAQHTGGTKGRIVRFSLRDGSLQVYLGQQLAEVL